MSVQDASTKVELLRKFITTSSFKDFIHEGITFLNTQKPQPFFNSYTYGHYLLAKIKYVSEKKGGDPRLLRLTCYWEILKIWDGNRNCNCLVALTNEILNILNDGELSIPEQTSLLAMDNLITTLDVGEIVKLYGLNINRSVLQTLVEGIVYSG